MPSVPSRSVSLADRSSSDVNHDLRWSMQVTDGRRMTDLRRHALQRIGKCGGSPKTHPRCALTVRANPDDVAAMLLGFGQLVPQVHRMHAMERLASAVEVAVPRVVGELLFIVSRDLQWIGRHGQYVDEEIHIRRMVQR